jgi:ribonuclease VapC
VARAVLDASAVIALVRNEPGSELVASFLGDALISAVNLQEVIKALLVRGFAQDGIRELLSTLDFEVRPHRSDDAWASALLFEPTRARGSGLGDRTCLALAIKEGLPAITTDKAWAELRIDGLEVVLAR